MEIELTEANDYTYRFSQSPHSEGDAIDLAKLKEFHAEGHLSEESQPEAAPNLENIIHHSEELEDRGFTTKFAGRVIQTLGGEDTVVIHGCWCNGDITDEIQQYFESSLLGAGVHYLQESDFLYIDWE